MPRRCVRSAVSRCGLLVVVATSFAAFPHAALPATYKLEYKFQQGNKANYEVTHEATLKTQKGQAALTAIQTSTSWKRYDFVSVSEDGTVTLEPTIDRVRMSIRSDANEGIEWDSSSGEDPPASVRNIADTIGRPLARLQVAPNGAVISAESLLPDPKRPAAQKPAENDPNDQAGADIFVVFPKEPIQIGHTWKDQFKVRVAVERTLRKPIVLQREYTLKSVTDNLATISLRTVVLTRVNDPRLQVQLIQRTPSGTIVFDMQQGLVVSRTLDVDKLVIGFAGGDSKIRAVSHRAEQFVPAGEASNVARQPIEASRQR